MSRKPPLRCMTIEVSRARLAQAREQNDTTRINFYTKCVRRFEARDRAARLRLRLARTRQRRVIAQEVGQQVEEEGYGGGGGFFDGGDDGFMDFAAEEEEGPPILPPGSVPGLALVSIQRQTMEQARRRAEEMVNAARQRIFQQAIRRIGEEADEPRRQALEDAARLAGVRVRRSLQRRELDRVQGALPRRGGLGSVPTSRQRSRAQPFFMDMLRAFRSRYLQGLPHGWNRPGRIYDPAMAANLGYYDIAERYRRLRNMTVAGVRSIPVEDIIMRANPVNMPQQNAALARAIAELAALHADPEQGALVQVVVNNVPLVGQNGNVQYVAAILSGAIQNPGGGGGGGGQNPVVPLLAQAIQNAIEEAYQSGEGVDWNALADPAFELQIHVQVMRPPAARGWSPRTEVESHFVRNTLRYIPPEVFLNDTICIPVAILTSSLRVIDDDGLVSSPMFEEKQMGLGVDEEVFELFDQREPLNMKYYDGKVDYLRSMAEKLMQSVGINRSDLDINVCEAIGIFLNVQINVLYQEAMCRRLFKFGPGESGRHVTILIREDHAFSVHKPWRFSGNGMPSTWCDVCHVSQNKRWSEVQMAHHRKSCSGISEDGDCRRQIKGHGVEYTTPRYTTLWHKKENHVLTAPYCYTCARFLVTAEAAQHGVDMEGPETSLLETCVSLGHQIFDDVEMGKCCICTNVFPVGWPRVDDAPKDKFGKFNEHRCEMPEPELKMGEAGKYYVWDIETLDVDSVHVPVYIYARSLYDEGEWYEFEGIDAFCRHVLNEKFKESTWIAHNSGGFDANFVHTWLEDHGIMHSRIPSPTSMHRSLETTVDHLSIRFIDSFCFIPMGLAKIGPAFNLPVVKGDFPHRFSKIEHMGYEGPMPLCDSEDDWYSLSSLRSSSAEKGEEAVAKFKSWHAQEAMKYVPHTERLWVYQEQLRSYCKKDCDVLAGALQCMRDAFMSVDGTVSGTGRSRFSLCAVDPLQYLTMAQVCQQLYIAGLYRGGGGLRICHIPLPDRIQSPAKIRWLLEEERRLGCKMWKAFTHMREWLADDGKPVDGFIVCNGGERHVFEYYDCAERGCPMCTPSAGHNGRYGCMNRDVYSKTMYRLQTLRKLGYKVTVRWSHDEATALVVDTSFALYNCMAAQRQQNDGGFYGGRVEVFKPYWKCKEKEQIRYIDVVSLYPWVCATQRMCTGVPTVYFGEKVDATRLDGKHRNPYFGYAHVRVKGAATDYFGGVPRKDRDTGRLVFDNTEYRVTCFIDELRERVSKGCEILEVYEVWHWPECESADGPMSGYVAHFLRDKMECSGWKALCGREPETEEDKVAVCDQLSRDNLGLCRPRPEMVRDNPGGRQLAKLRLNMLWGKFVQCPRSVTTKFIQGYADYVKLWYDNQVDKSTLMFRRISDGLDFMEVKYSYNNSVRAPPNTHYYLGGSCTAQARLKLTSMLREVGEDRALYCDTDSVVYVQREGDEEVETGEALGQWSSEMDAGVWGQEFMALAPKCYMLRYNDEGRRKERESGMVKAKGVTLTVENLREINADTMKKIIMTEVFGDVTGEDRDFVVQAKTFNIRLDHAGDRSVVSVHGQKVVRCVYSKREIRVPDGTDPYDVHFIDTVPFM